MDLTEAWQCLLSGCWEDGARLFTQWCMMGGQETTDMRWRKRLFYWKVIFPNRKTFFSIWIVRQWNRLPRKTVPSPSLGIFKIKLAKALSHLLWSQNQSYSEQRVGQDDCLRSSPSWITLWFCNSKSLYELFRKTAAGKGSFSYFLYVSFTLPEILHADEYCAAVWKILRLV